VVHMSNSHRARLRNSCSKQGGLVLLVSAASLSMMAALGLALIGSPSAILTQTAQVQAGDQALRNAESGYNYAMSLIRDGGLSALEARQGQSFSTGAGSFRLELVELDAFQFGFSSGQGAPVTLNPTGDLSGVQLPEGQTLPRLNGRFFVDGVEYRYASFAADAGVLFGVERADGSPDPITIPNGAVFMIPGRSDIISVGTFGSAERTLVRVAGPAACNTSLVITSDDQTLASGTPAVATWDAHPRWTARLVDATWISDSYLEPNPQGDRTIVFEREFSLPAGSTEWEGTIAIAADNSYVCTLNGLGAQQMTSSIETNYFMENIGLFALNEWLVSGSNLLRCEVVNWGQPGVGTAHTNPAGLLYRMDIGMRTLSTPEFRDPGSCNSSLVIASNEQTLVNGSPAVATWDAHPRWTARLTDATWIWDSYLEPDPRSDRTVVFDRVFSLPSGATGLEGTIAIGADNSYVCTLNGDGADRLVSAIETNYFMEDVRVFSVNDLLVGGDNLFQCEVRNWGQPERGTAYSNPAGLLYRMDISFQE
jgi:hypothetical protein